MGKVETIIKSEIIRLAKGEMRKVSIPLGRDVRLLKNTVSQLRKSVLSLERFAAQKQKELSNREIRLEAPPEEIKQSRFSPRLLQSLRKRLGITQKELAILAGVTVGAAHLWETGKFRPKDNKMGVLVALKKLNRREVRELLNQKIAGKTGR
jgi:DNA-binding transcriptional regulator YiaG